MIKVNSYQVYNNCKGDVIVPEGYERTPGMSTGAIKCEQEFETEEDLEAFRSGIEEQHTTKKTPNVVVMFNTTLIPD